MECGKAACENDRGGCMVAFELEAAEALAGLARNSTSHGSASCSGELNRTKPVVFASATQSQDQAVVTEEVCANASTLNKCPQMFEKLVESSPCQLCMTCSQSKPVIKFSRKLTEAEKQERKTRRILANRESARETIRRRQAMYLELTRKASDVVEENENLKKKKDLAAEEYTWLKSRNEFLKSQLAEAKKAAAGVTEHYPNTSNAEPCPATTTLPPMFLHNQPSIFPCFWPSSFPSSDVFPFQCPSQFRVPQRDTPCPHQRQEQSMGTPLFVVPAPWLLSLLSHSSANDNTTPHHCNKCSCSDSQPPHEDRNQSSSSQTAKTMVVPGLFSPVRPVEVPGPPQSCHVSTPESGGSQRNEAPIIQKKPADMFAASVARRRRKEVLKMKNVHCHDVRTHY